MPQYLYSAMDGNGKEQKGKINADSEEMAAVELKSKGLFPTSIKPAVLTSKKKAANRTGKKKGGGSLMNVSLGAAVIKRKDLTVVTRQLAILLSAGLPLIRSLHTLEKQARNPAVKQVVSKTAETVEGGATFAEALAQHPKSFDKLYLNMVRAGEASGAMEIILDRLASFMEKAARISGKVKSAMIYPTVVLSIAILAIVGLMIFIVPNFQKIFKELLGPEEPLPDITLLVMGISNTLITDWYFYIGGIAAVIALYQVIVHIPIGKWGVDWVKYNMPLFGPIISKTAISRFSRTLGTLMSSGVPVLNALALEWAMLQAQNAPLRAVVNGRPVSVPEDFYDSFVRDVLRAQPEEFREAEAIGTLLATLRPGISDGFAARRIEALVQAGLLEAMSSPAPGRPVYDRVLRKKGI